MRINKFVAQASGLSRRKADSVIEAGRVTVNGLAAKLGLELSSGDVVALDNKLLVVQPFTTIVLNKPVGYVCSRNGQGNLTIYDLLPKEFHHLKPVGRLDKDSSGLLLLTNDGELAQKLTHPSHQKEKKYEVEFDKELSENDMNKIENGVQLDDGMSRLKLAGAGKRWTVTMHEGRNRQIRRTFEALNYKVIKLHRTQFGPYRLGDLGIANYSFL